MTGWICRMDLHRAHYLPYLVSKHWITLSAPFIAASCTCICLTVWVNVLFCINGSKAGLSLSEKTYGHTAAWDSDPGEYHRHSYKLSSFKFLLLSFLILLYHLPFVILHLNPAPFQVHNYYSEFAIRCTWGYYYLYANTLWGATTGSPLQIGLFVSDHLKGIIR